MALYKIRLDGVFTCDETRAILAAIGTVADPDTIMAETLERDVFFGADRTDESWKIQIEAVPE